MRAHTTWGADRKVLLRLYRALIRSKLDYGCIVYSSERPSYIKRLDTVHNPTDMMKVTLSEKQHPPSRLLCRVDQLDS